MEPRESIEESDPLILPAVYSLRSTADRGRQCAPCPYVPSLPEARGEIGRTVCLQ